MQKKFPTKRERKGEICSKLQKLKPAIFALEQPRFNSSLFLINVPNYCYTDIIICSLECLMTHYSKILNVILNLDYLAVNQ